MHSPCKSWCQKGLKKVEMCPVWNASTWRFRMAQHNAMHAGRPWMALRDVETSYLNARRLTSYPPLTSLLLGLRQELSSPALFLPRQGASKSTPVTCMSSYSLLLSNRKCKRSWTPRQAFQRECTWEISAVRSCNARKLASASATHVCTCPTAVKREHSHKTSVRCRQRSHSLLRHGKTPARPGCFAGRPPEHSYTVGHNAPLLKVMRTHDASLQ
eukprot:1160862-Pelagomonas_calceolata.AAC.8